MSLKLTVADNKKLKALLAKIDKDKMINPAEFLELRSMADSEVEKASLLAIRDNMRVISNAADIFADGLKMLSLELRRLGYAATDQDPVKNAQKQAEKKLVLSAIEAQLAYMTYSQKFMFGKM